MVIIIRPNTTHEPLIDNATLLNTIRTTEAHIGNVRINILGDKK